MLKHKQMRLLIIVVLIVLSKSIYSQNTIIRGQVKDYDSAQPLEGVPVFIDSNNGTLTDENGKFNFKVNNAKLKYSLKIGFINYYAIEFINLPTNADTLTLNDIPLFYYCPDELNPITIFCNRCDFICKWRRHKQMKIEEKRLAPYYNDRNKIIENYIYIFQNKKYPINLNKHSIDLKNNNLFNLERK